MLSLLGIMVLIEKKHTAGLSISWKALLLVQVLTLVGEILTLVPQYPSAIAAAQALRATGNEFYEMAARDKLCGNNLVALKDLDIGAWIDEQGWAMKSYELYKENCVDQRWIGAPDPADDLKRRTYDGLTGWFDPFNPCADAEPHSPLALGFGWYLLAWHFQCIYLLFLVSHFVAKEKAIRAREMAVQPAVDTDDNLGNDNPGDNPAGVIILQDRVEKRLLCRMLTHWKMLVDEILWVPGGKRFREHSLTCLAATAMQA